MKDYIKIFEAADAKRAKQEKENIIALQKEGLYPKKYSFPTTLQFELTGACNLACKHCYNRSGDDDRIKNTRMTVNEWKRLAGYIVDNGGIFQCIISGGEPLLLGDGLFEIMDILHEDGTSFVVITNGMLLNEMNIRKFKRYRYFWFQISIDGSSAELHDSFRGVKGCWEKTVAGAMGVTNSGIPLVVAHTVIPKTLPLLEDMVKLAYSLGAGSIMVGEVLPSGRAIYNKNIILSHEQRNYLYEQINELSIKYAGRIRIERSMNVRSSMARYLSQPNCGGIIRPNGDFRLDCMVPFSIGNVLESSLKDIWDRSGCDAWHNPQVMDFIRSIDEETQQGDILNHVSEDIRI